MGPHAMQVAGLGAHLLCLPDQPAYPDSSDVSSSSLASALWTHTADRVSLGAMITAFAPASRFFCLRSHRPQQ